MSSLDNVFEAVQISGVYFLLIYFYGVIWTQLQNTIFIKQSLIRNLLIGLFLGLASLSGIIVNKDNENIIIGAIPILAMLTGLLGGFSASAMMGGFVALHLIINPFHHRHANVGDELALIYFLLITGSFLHIRWKLNLSNIDFTRLMMSGMVVIAATLVWILAVANANEMWTTHIAVVVAVYPIMMLATGLFFISVLRRAELQQLVDEKEARYQIFMQNNPDPILICDKEGNFLDINSASIEFFGYSREELLHMSVFDLVTPENLEIKPSQLDVLNQGQEIHIERIARRKDGEIVIVDVRAQLQVDGTIISSLRDITLRRKIEREIAHQYEFEELLMGISTRFINLPLEEIDREIATALGIIGQFIEDVDRSYVFLLDEDGQTASNTHEWCSENIEPMQDQLQKVDLKIGQWALDKLKNGATIGISDISKIPSEAKEFERFLEAQSIQSLVMVPLSFDNRTFGFIGLDSVKQKKSWQSNDLNLLKLAGEIFANTLRRKENQTRLRRQNQYLLTLHETALALANRYTTSNIFDVILNQVSTVSNSKTAFLYLVDPETDSMVRKLTVGHEFPLEHDAILRGEGVAGLVWETRKIQLIDNYSEWQNRLTDVSDGQCLSVIGIPLILQNDVVGVIILCSGNQQSFSFEVLEVLEYFGDLASIALDNTRLNAATTQEMRERVQVEEDLRRRNEALAILHDFSIKSTRFLPASEDFDWVTSAVKLVFPQANSITIQRLDPTTGYMQTVFDGDYHQIDPTKTIKFKRGFGIAGLALESNSVINIPDISKDDRYITSSYTPSFQSLLVAPMLVGDRPIGTISIGSPLEAAFSVQDEQIAEMLAHQTAVVIDNVSLYNQERDQRIFAETLRDVATILSKSIDLDTTLDEILELIQYVIPYTCANIMFFDENDNAYFASTKGYEEQGIDLNTISMTTSEFATFTEMIETQKPLLIENTRVHPGWIRREASAFIESELGAPIVSSGKVLGLINLDGHQPAQFTPENAVQLGAFANQISIGFEKKKLFDAEHEQRQLAEALRDTAADLNSTLDTEEILERILGNLSQVLPHKGSSIILINDDGQGYFVKARDTLTNSFSSLLKTAPFDIEKFGALRKMAETRQPLIIPDITKSDLWTNLDKNNWIKSWAGAPIVSENKVIGFINLDSDELDFFKSAHSERLKVFANQASIAINRARLYEKERTQRLLAVGLSNATVAINSTLGLQELLDRILTVVGRVIPHDGASIMLMEKRSKVRFVGASGVIYENYPNITELPPQAIEELYTIQEMVKSRQPLIITDTKADPLWQFVYKTQNVLSYMGVPIRNNDQIIGFINLDSLAPHAFSNAQAATLQIFADQAGLAIQKVTLLEAERRQREIAETLSEIGLALVSTRDRTEILSKILDQVARVVPFSAAGIWLKGEDQRWGLAVGVGYEKFNVSNEINELKLNHNSTPEMVEMFATKRPVIVSDMSNQDPLVKGFEWLNSWAGTPILLRGEMIGKLALDHTQAGFYDEEHIPILEALAVQISIAIENARLFEAERSQREIAETLREIGLVLSSTLHREIMLPTILEQALRVIDYTSAGIWLKDRQGRWGMVTSRGYDLYGAKEFMQDMSFSGNETGAIQSIVIEGQPVVISHYEPKNQVFSYIQSWIGAPIILKGEIIGILAMDHATKGYYQDYHMLILSSLAAQISIAIHNAHLFDAAEHQRQIADTLREIGLVLTSTLDRSSILPAILEQAARVIDFDAAGIWLPDENDFWYMETGFGYENFNMRDFQYSLRFKLEDLPSLMTMNKTRQPFILSTYDHVSFPLTEHYQWLNSLATAPVIFRDKLVATIAFDHTVPGYYTEAHIPILQALAAQVSIAIENATLYQQTLTKAADLEKAVNARTEELDRERTQLSTILEGMGDGVIFIEFDTQQSSPELGTIRYINQRLVEMVGFSRHELEQKSIREMAEMCLGDDENEGFLVKLWQYINHEINEPSSNYWSPQIVFQRKDKSSFDAQLTFSMLNLGDTLIRYGVALVRDISQEKALQRDRLRFLANASHELRTPLTNLVTRIYLLRHQPERAESHIDVIGSTVQSMTRLVNDLLDYLRMEEGVLPQKLEEFDILEVVRRMHSIQSGEAEIKNLTFDIEVPPNPILVQGNRKHLEHVLTNLASNSINYTPAGGHVKISVETTTDYVTIHVEDNGFGIAPENHQAIFEPFFRVEDHDSIGTGLGLAITKETVELYGGQILVKSELGKGSIFTVILPRRSDLFNAPPQPRLLIP